MHDNHQFIHQLNLKKHISPDEYQVTTAHSK
jgi:hypothetical protein